MKRLFLVCCLLSLVACTKELPEDSGARAKQTEAIIVGSPARAAKGTLAVKLTPAAAQLVAQAKTRGGDANRSGVANMDAVLAQIGAQNFNRIVDFDPEWEAVYSQTGLNRWYRISFPDEVALEKACQLFAEQPEIAVVEYTINPRYRKPTCEGPARPLTATDLLPERASTRADGVPMNDPFLRMQWHYDNEGPAGYGKLKTPPSAGADINLYDAWQLCTGNQQVIVAVIDEPVQTTHPDLAANMWSKPSNPNEHGYNFWNQTAQLDWKTAYNDPKYGWEYADHGSHVAGVIAAVNNNNIGTCGVAGGKNGNGVKIMSCQIMGYSDTNKDIDAHIKAFAYALKNGAVIAQNSWGYNNEDGMNEEIWNNAFGVSRDAIDTFIASAGIQNPNSPIKGGIVLFAAGNSGDINHGAKTWPSAYGPVIAVGSMDWRFQPAYYTDYGNWVDITAPGGDKYLGKAKDKDGYYKDAQILSTILCDDEMKYKDGRKDEGRIDMYGYGFMQGTSMACPHVAGVAALGLSYAAQLGKQFTAKEYTALLLSSVYGIDSYLTGSKPEVANLAAYKNGMGGGCIDALKLLLAIKGTPAIYVKMGTPTMVDFAQYFGGTNSNVKLRSAKAPDIGKLGTSIPAINGKQMTFNCTKPGVTMLTITATAGDKEFTKEFALVSRAGLSSNGGWL